MSKKINPDEQQVKAADNKIGAATDIADNGVVDHKLVEEEVKLQNLDPADDY